MSRADDAEVLLTATYPPVIACLMLLLNDGDKANFVLDSGTIWSRESVDSASSNTLVVSISHAHRVFPYRVATNCCPSSVIQEDMTLIEIEESIHSRLIISWRDSESSSLCNPVSVNTTLRYN